MSAMTEDAVEKVAKFMLDHSFATGPGDSVDDLLAEFSWQIRELLERGFRTPGAIEKCEKCGYEFGDGFRFEHCYYSPFNRHRHCPIEKARLTEQKKRWPSWKFTNCNTDSAGTSSPQIQETPST